MDGCHLLPVPEKDESRLARADVLVQRRHLGRVRGVELHGLVAVVEKNALERAMNRLARAGPSLVHVDDCGRRGGGGRGAGESDDRWEGDARGADA